MRLTLRIRSSSRRQSDSTEVIVSGAGPAAAGLLSERCGRKGSPTMLPSAMGPSKRKFQFGANR